MVATKSRPHPPDLTAARLTEVEKELRAALAGAPHVQQLFQEWIDLRLGPTAKEGLCQRQ